MDMGQTFRLFREVSAEDIKKIFIRSLGESPVWPASLMDGGLFNTTYHVTYGAERREAVLRLGPVNRQFLMGHEENLMRAEVEVCRLCAEHGIPCSKVLAWDCSRAVVDRDYMIVEYIPSVAMNQAELTGEERDALYQEMGAWLRRFHEMEGDSFGFVSRILEGKRFSSWGDALLFETEDILSRMEKYLGCDGRVVREAFCRNKPLLDCVETGRLLHTDMWEGNVLLDRETHEILALIDGDRAVYGDPDFEFASSWMENPALLRGYGTSPAAQTGPERRQRRILYQIFYALLEAYVEFEKYGSRERYSGEIPHINRLLAELD